MLVSYIDIDLYLVNIEIQSYFQNEASVYFERHY